MVPLSAAFCPTEPKAPEPVPEPTPAAEPAVEEVAEKVEAVDISAQEVQQEVEVVEEEEGDNREHLNIVFIGHVDAGKSTIGGQILFLAGMVDDRTIQKYEREAKDKNREVMHLQ